MRDSRLGAAGQANRREDASDIPLDELDARILFYPEREMIELDFSGLHLEDSRQANHLFDRIEAKIEASGERLWFFLLNYANFQIEPQAWLAYAHRGKALNLAHAMGSVRFDATVETQRLVEETAAREQVDVNICATREDALARVAAMPSLRMTRADHTPNYTADEIAARVSFTHDSAIMEADFSGVTFAHSRDVDDFYDHLEEAILETGRKWYFLVNYNGCRILPEAWVQFARRGKALNLGGGLGSVRYATGSETEADIRLRAQSQSFRPNIRNTRAEALARIEEMKAEATH